MPVIESIAVATDFSDAGNIAFVHALRLSLEFKCRLELIHVREPGDKAEWDAFPHVRETLERWDLLPAGSKTGQVFETLGIDVRKV
ncbi:MAG: universal stress protein, partial [Croceibacterium sp.]